jgi:GTP-binding protein
MRNQVGDVEFLGSFDERVMPVIGLPEIAFAGRSNVGKSSAINCLLRRKSAARVSGTPGRTQRINLFRVGRACVFADLPGYGFARVPEAVQAGWKPMIEHYLGEREALRLVVLLVDARREPQELDLALIDGLQQANLRHQVVITKADKLSKHERRPVLLGIQQAYELDHEPILFSSHQGDGRDEVWDVMEAAAAAPSGALSRSGR